MRDVLRSLAREGVLTVEVTVAASSSYVGFLESYARALVAAETPAGRLRRWTSELLDSVRPEVRFEARSSGEPGFSLAFPAVRTARDTARLAAEVFALPARIAAARKQRMAVMLDEFQAVESFDEGNVEQALRAAVQDQRQVGYVFAGSEPSLMEKMLTPKRPFYKAGPVMRLQKIDPDEFGDWLEQRFKSTRIAPEPGLGAAIVDLAGNVPYDVQRLAHEAWDDVHEAGRRAVGLDDLHRTLTRLLDEQHTMFEESWQRLTLAQRAALAGPGPRGRARDAVGRRAHEASPLGRVERAGRADRAREAGRGDEGRPDLRRHRLALPRVGRAQDVLGRPVTSARWPSPAACRSPPARSGRCRA